MVVPERPKIYHITHVSNLPRIIESGGLVSDAVMIDRGGPQMAIGMTRIKERRLTLPVGSHHGTSVGDYVPFYFCPRSVMLYLLDRRNSPDLSYKDGQEPIVHLECDLQNVIDRAGSDEQRWAFTSSNAGARYSQFYDDIDDIKVLNWPAINAHDWRDPAVKEGKQAEFLYHGEFPWELVERIGVQTPATLNRVLACLTDSQHQPRTVINRQWYY